MRIPPSVVFVGFLAGLLWAGPAAIAGAPTATCSALIQDYPRGRLYEWVNANRAHLASLLPADESGRYVAAIAGRHCEAAEALLEAQFRRAFPQMGCLFAPFPPNGGTVPWRLSVASEVYPDLSLCFAEEELAAGLTSFTAAGVKPPIADWFRRQEDRDRDFGSLAKSLYSIDQGVGDIATACTISGYHPACIAYARLANEGVVVRISDDRLFFYLVRARLKGFDNAEQVQLEAAVGARLTPAARSAIDDLVRRSLTQDVDLPR